MENSSYAHPSVLTLDFREMSSMRYLYGVLAFLIYLIIIMLNGVLIATIALHKTLHEPMYIFVSVLCINGLYGTTAFFPSLIFNLLSDTKTITYIGCVIQAFCSNSYAACEITILTIMAYDRYVCILNPLRYINIMSLTKVWKLVLFSLLYNIILIGINMILTIRLPLCDSVIVKVNCDNWSIVRLSCADVTVNNIFGLFISLTYLTVLPLLISISYIQILQICLKSSKNFRAKALQTCTPHLITMAIYMTNLYSELLISRISYNTFNYELRMAILIQIIVLPPVLNPVIYGLKLKEIWVKIIQTFYLKRRTGHD